MGASRVTRGQSAFSGYRGAKKGPLVDNLAINKLCLGCPARQREKTASTARRHVSYLGGFVTWAGPCTPARKDHTVRLRGAPPAEVHPETATASWGHYLERAER
jgi:hypothetical protein